MEPTVYLEAAYQQPPGTSIATKVVDMFTISPEFPTHISSDYFVGLPPIIQNKVYTVKNITTNVDLEFNITVPSYFVVNVPMQFTLSPDISLDITISFVENIARQLSQTTTRNHVGAIQFLVFPRNVTGPIFIKNSIV